ncbi:hypothetical protein VP01_2766g1 [Puccinia sorghi]|uniref:Uncharacterized protein n=1 Tax=Puccinia sorghi TaxID=27349 RepID=A0A0L6V2X2_9BASI|nr:hypothetical protein VP01_2766g1 [Puccinia sorghi]
MSHTLKMSIALLVNSQVVFLLFLHTAAATAETCSYHLTYKDSTLSLQSTSESLYYSQLKTNRHLLEKKKKPWTKPFKMYNINSTILKTTIKAVPILTEDNFSSWRTQITVLLKLGGLKDQMINGQPALCNKDDNKFLSAIILSKLSPHTQNNFVNSENAHLLWKAILKGFISSEPSNRTRVFNQFTNITFDANGGQHHHLTSSQTTPEQLTTSSNLKVSNARKGEYIFATMYTNDDQRCFSGTHNPDLKTHTKDKFWAIYPKKCLAFLKKKEESQVISFSTFSCIHPSVFILDSGTSSHMVSEQKFFINLDKDKISLINTSCGLSTLQIKGKVSIKTKFKD